VIHLDTSFLVRGLLRGSTQDRLLRKWLRSGETLGASVIVWTEFLCGPVDAGEIELAKALIVERVDFTGEDAVLAARLFNESGRRRGALADCMIAATALRRGVGLATENTADFRRFRDQGLEVLSAGR
jgi:predicted nucleic acid-binding protein